MPKTWDDMSQTEKIEELRRDVLKIYSAFNGLVSDVRGTSSKLNEVAKAVEVLEGRLPKARPKKTKK
jgi:hypothetical protein